MPKATPTFPARLRGLLLPLAVVILAVTPFLPASAAVITQSHIFPVNTGFPSFNKFDPALGSLDEVRVSIFGTAIPTVFAQHNLVPIGPGVIFPTPYLITALYNHDLNGLFGGFDFGTPAVFTTTGFATGIPGPVVLTPLVFGYEFHFDATSDLLGFSFLDAGSFGYLAPPVPINGARDDFTQASVVDTFFMMQTSFLFHSAFASPPPLGGPPSPISVQGIGTMDIDYIYTPATQDVPEPTALALLGLGLAGLGLMRRRRKAV